MIKLKTFIGLIILCLLIGSITTDVLAVDDKSVLSDVPYSYPVLDPDIDYFNY